jgi:hypothetical protein
MSESEEKDMFDLAIEEVDPKDIILRHIINTVYIHYVSYNKIPTVAVIVKSTPYSEKQVTTAVARQAFLNAMRNRGVPWKSEVERTPPGLSSEQAYVLTLLTDPSDRRDLTKKLQAARVSYGKFRSWMRQPLFSATLSELSNQMLRDNMASVDNALVQQALRGNLNAIQYFHQLTGRFDPNQQAAMEVSSILNAVVEIISTHVKQPETLTAISQDVTKLAMDAGLIKMSALQQVQQAIQGEVLGGE